MVKSQPGFIGNEDDALKYFQEGNAAMIVTGSWSLPRLREMGIAFQVNSFPFEDQVSQPLLNVHGFLMSRESRFPDAAQNLLFNYLTTPQAMLSYSGLTGASPARRDVLEKLEDPELRLFGIAGANGIPIPNLPEMDVVWGPWTDAIRAIISGEMPAFDAFKNAAIIIRKQLGQ
jgi:maltose-binding protein MalE